MIDKCKGVLWDEKEECHFWTCPVQDYSQQEVIRIHREFHISATVFFYPGKPLSKAMTKHQKDENGFDYHILIYSVAKNTRMKRKRHKKYWLNECVYTHVFKTAVSAIGMSTFIHLSSTILKVLFFPRFSVRLKHILVATDRNWLKWHFITCHCFYLALMCPEEDTTTEHRDSGLASISELQNITVYCSWEEKIKDNHQKEKKKRMQLSWEMR